MSLIRVPDETLLFEVTDLLRAMPSSLEFTLASNDVLSWVGRARAVVAAWDGMKSVYFSNDVSHLVQPFDNPQLHRKVSMTLLEAQHSLRMKTSGPLNVAIAAGNVFEYYDEIRKAISEATEDLLFVDPYLDADFVSDYLPHVKPSVVIRLLTSEKKLSTLLPSVDRFSSQHGVSVEVRVTPNIHDRLFLVDGAKCYLSGASFKDGARRTPTTLTQITDVFAATKSTYEHLWSVAKIER